MGKDIELAILFADVVGSTRLYELMGDLRARDMVATPGPRHGAPGGSTRDGFLIAVVGNPNSGKTTLFNALTGLRQQVANYPGVTVERREAALAGDSSVRLLDLPGLYSLSADSPDQVIARQVLLGKSPDLPRPDAVLLVADASNLERNLFAASQILEMGLPAVLVCNMADVLAGEGLRLDAEALSRALGVPVVTTVASRGEGVPAVLAAIRELCEQGAAIAPERIQDPEN